MRSAPRVFSGGWSRGGRTSGALRWESWVSEGEKRTPVTRKTVRLKGANVTFRGLFPKHPGASGGRACTCSPVFQSSNRSRTVVL